ncbi:hypothetical protein CBW42_03740 [Butyricicoccus porcorum]|uniref:Uncharacterized protein n=2 Tax=Butyricicoccus porcorum TaxID=1945634 RepID=A0A252F5U8_9FIRM|nr:hypothetical protein CBW42_03740 [Butyricicoccus porcorum]
MTMLEKDSCGYIQIETDAVQYTPCCGRSDPTACMAIAHVIREEKQRKQRSAKHRYPRVGVWRAPELRGGRYAGK